MLKSAIIYFSGRLSAALITLFAISVYTRLLSPAEYGVYALVFSSVIIVYASALQWLAFSLGRFLPEYADRENIILSHVATGYVAVALVATVGALLCMAVLTLDVSWRTIMVAALCLLLMMGFAELNLILFQMRLNPYFHSKFTLLRSVVAVAIGVTLAYSGYGSVGLLFGLVVGNLCIILPNLARNWGSVRLGLLRRELFQGLAAYGFPLAITGALGAIIHASDRYIIGVLIGAEATGLYAAPYDLAMRSLHVLMMVVAMAYNPVIVRAYETEDRMVVAALIRRQAEVLLGVALPAAIAFVMLTPGITHILLGEAFQESARTLIPWVATATVLGGVQSFYLALSFSLTKRPLRQTAAFVLGAVVNVLLNFALIPRFGLIGAALATVIAYALILVCSFVLGRRLFALPFPSTGLAKIIVACAAWALMLWPVTNTTAVAPLLLHGLAGGGAYLVIFCGLDVGDTRRLFRRAWRLGLGFMHARREDLERR